MPLPVPSSPAGAGSSSLPRPSSLPTPSRRPTASSAVIPPSGPTTDATPPTPTSQSSSSPSRLTRSRHAVSVSRQSSENDPSSEPHSESEKSENSQSSTRMPPPPVPAQSSAATAASGGKQSRDRPVVRRATGTRNLKGKEDMKKPERQMSLRSATRSSSISTTASAAAKARETVDKATAPAPSTTRTLRPRNASASTAALGNGDSATERQRTASISSRPTATKKEPVPTTRQRSGVPASAAASRRPVSYHADTSTSQPTASGSTAPRKAAAPTASGARTHRRNLSTPSTTAVQPPRPPTAASTASNVSKSRRPPFSTLRQDFSAPPAPATQSSRKAMPPPPLDSATIHQQTQLLQYTCLYANSHATYAQMTASATAKLKRRFDVLAKEHSRSREQLARRQRIHDMAGLTAVVESPAVGVTGKRRETMRSPEEKIQAFSEAIKKLEALQQNEHCALTSVFGDWIAGYSPPSPSLCTDKVGWVAKRGRWIDGLGEDWRRQCLFISRRIEGAVKAIETVVSAVMMEEEGGVVSVVSERWMDIARGMLEESQGMLQVEQNVVSRERAALGAVVAAAGAQMNEEENKIVKGVWVEEEAGG